MVHEVLVNLFLIDRKMEISGPTKKTLLCVSFLRGHVKIIVFLVDASAKALTPHPLAVSGHSEVYVSCINVYVDETRKA